MGVVVMVGVQKGGDEEVMVVVFLVAVVLVEGEWAAVAKAAVA